MTKQEMLLTIPTREKLFLINCDYTRLPYVVCNTQTFDDEVYMFTKEEDANAYVTELNSKNFKVSVLTLEKDKVLKAFTSLIYYGINAVVFHDEKEVHIFQLNEIVKIPNKEDLEENKRPIDNPTLQLTMLYFCQEVRSTIGSPNKEKLKELEEEMLINVSRSKFLMPFKEVEVEGKKSVQVLMIKTSNDMNMIPIFTDHMELRKFNQTKEIKLSVIDFPKLVALPLPPNAGGYLINPLGVGVPLGKAWLSIVKENLSKNKPKV